jgi:uncharacterized protein (TIGR03546 family)
LVALNVPRLITRPILLLAQILTEASSPRQIAWGLALGTLVGLVPKGNLTAAILCLVVLAVRCNLAAAALATMVFSWLGMCLDPLTHRLGLALLTSPMLRPAWDWLYEQPLMPWMRLHNTVVLGNLLTGLALLLPLYAIGLRATQRFGSQGAELVRRLGLARVAAYAHRLSGWSLR